MLGLSIDKSGRAKPGTHKCRKLSWKLHTNKFCEVKNRRPKVLDTRGGDWFCKKNVQRWSKSLVCFFPVKIEIAPNLTVEISTGSTPEIYTGNTLKSRNNYGQKTTKISNFSDWNLLLSEISGGPNFYFLKNMASHLHFALWIKFITQKLTNLVLIKVCGFWRKSYLIFWIFWLSVFRQNPHTLINTRFASVWVMNLIQSAKWS